MFTRTYLCAVLAACVAVAGALPASLPQRDPVTGKKVGSQSSANNNPPPVVPVVPPVSNSTNNSNSTVIVSNNSTQTNTTVPNGREGAADACARGLKQWCPTRRDTGDDDDADVVNADDYFEPLDFDSIGSYIADLD